ncbi:MAG: 23S rRNA (pseudouridine(1915)-N(3))-methyltransferase RlmH [Bacteroidia bacterium]|nr:23S rRNA (pseudouridine(1915)-N(3))-methyltransferase RlmH [Bacteroidia bacterium]MBP9688878.1 23S rRNA (pseudouridine(1915)-N(3))-methyltransferase RlmH [Bacteroidia bacterium]
MKITLLQLGKTHFKFVDTGFEEFSKRLKHYCKFDSQLFELPTRLKTTDINLTKKNEGELLLKKLNPNDFVILLDENGKEYTSTVFADYLQKLSVHQAHVVFIIGGAYGFSDDVYARANAKVSLSQMTFSHQLIRLIFIEQLYRAFTIIKGEPYHHE